MDCFADNDIISREESFMSEGTAKKFVTETLKINKLEEKFEKDKLSLLNEIMTAWQSEIPFQNLSHIATEADPSLRRIPTMEENISYVLSLKGGLCWTHNAAMHTLLHVLGYEVILGISGAFRPHANDHVVVLVKNLTTSNSIHIADVGFGSVNPKAICLDFDVESEIVNDIYTPYKYRKYEGWFVRCHKPKPGAKLRGVQLDGWELVYYFKLQEKTYDQIKDYLAKTVYCNPEDGFNQDSFMTVILDGRFVFLQGRTLKVEKSPGGELDRLVLEEDEQLMEAIFRYFPTVPKEEVKKAFNTVKIQSQV